MKAIARGPKMQLSERRPVPQDISEWLRRFPLSKRKNLLAGYLSGLTDLGFDAFIKKEKTVIVCSDLMPNDDVVSDRIRFSTRKLDPRIISVPDEYTRCHYSTICSAVNTAMQETYSGQVAYAPGMNASECSAWVIWAYNKVRDGELPWAAIFQGDDSLSFVQRGTAGIFYSSCDISRFEQSINGVMQASAKDFQRWLLWDWGRLEIGDTHFAEFRAHSAAKRRYKAMGISCSVEGIQVSGFGDTITTNTLNVAPPVIFGLDSALPLPAVFRSVGMFCKEDTGPFEPGNLRMEFLQRRLYRCLDTNGQEGYRFGPRIGRILVRAFWVDIRPGKHYKGYARAIAEGLLATAQHVPLVNTICSRVLDLTGGCKKRYDLEARRRIEYLELLSVVPDRPVQQHPQTMADVALLYGVDQCLLVRYDQFLAQWSWGEPIDPEWATELVLSLIRVDLE